MDPEINPMLNAVESGINAADTEGMDEEAKRLKEAEENEVKALWEEYEQARKFDRDSRAQYAVDRRYAAGTANLNWAVTANLIGAFIDILVSFLYARNPDVSARKAKRVDPIGTGQEDDFGKTMELVISSLWKAPSARLKTNARAQVRSVLTTGIGWLKVLMVSNGTNIPQLQNELGDIRKNLAQIEELKARLARDAAAAAIGTPDPAAEFGEDAALMAPPPVAPPVEDPENPYCAMSIEERDVEEGRLRDLEASVSNRLEVAIRKGLAVDVVSPEDMQVSLDVRSVTDHAIANWNANAIYRPTKSLAAMFPALKESDIKAAKQYFQRRTKDLQPLSETVKLTGVADSDVDAEAAEQYTAGGGNGNADEQGGSFAKIVELWNRETGHVYTMVEGVKKWAKAPYQPDYASTRFYPYFQIAFYPVDGARHPQSLTWRLMKLQDEYASTRSSLRLTRQRAVPGVVFNATELDETEAKKLSSSVHQELIGLKPVTHDKPMRDLFSEKPIAIGDMRLFDTAPILADMERISGVQEALQQSSTAPKTATEAEIQQSGFASRTTADRDVLETMLTELAHYTGELALQALDMKDAERIAGAKAFWPHGMSIDDLLTMVEVTIEAGTTGKPKSSGDRDAWGVVMPLIKESMLQIRQALMIGDQGMADALIALLQETLTRMGDDSDITRFIPQPPQTVPAMPGAPGAPGMPGAPPAPGGAPGEIPPAGPEADFAGQPTNPEMAPPDLAPPDLTAPQ